MIFMKKLILPSLLILSALSGWSQKIKETKTDNTTGEKIVSTMPEMIYAVTSKDQYISTECIRKGNQYTLILRVTTTNTVYVIQQNKPLILKLSNDSLLRLPVPEEVYSKLGGGIQESLGQIKYGISIPFKLSEKEKNVLVNYPVKLIRVYADNFSDDYEIKSKKQGLISKQLKFLEKQ